MHHSHLVHEADGRHQALQQLAGLGLAKQLLPLNPLQQLAALEELHHQVGVVLVGVDLVQLDDVGVRLALPQGGDLPLGVGLHPKRAGESDAVASAMTLKEFPAVRKAGEAPRSPAADDLDGKLALALLVSALPAHREAALAQRRPAEAQLVVLEKL